MAQTYMNRQQKIDNDVFERLEEYGADYDTAWQPEDYEEYNKFMELQSISAYNEAKDNAWHSKARIRALTQTSPIGVGDILKA